MKKVIRVEGMSCSHCVQAVSNAINALDGVSKVGLVWTAIRRKWNMMSQKLIRKSCILQLKTSVLMLCDEFRFYKFIKMWKCHLLCLGIIV